MRSRLNGTEKTGHFLFPVFSNLYETAIFALDVKSAQAFGHEFQNSVAKLGAFEEGSIEIISADVLTNWDFSIGNNGTNLVINISDKKKLNFPLRSKINSFSGNFEDSVNFKLVREKATISVTSI